MPHRAAGPSLLSAAARSLTFFLLTGCLLYDRAYYERALLRFSDDDGDHWSEAQGDCDDTNPTVSPWNDEYCNGLDDDCDGLADNNVPLDVIDWYQDGDGDTYGLQEVKILACEQPEGYVHDDNDCDDSNPAIHPEAAEVCDDTIDMDCDGKPGNNDRDGDGFRDCEDCDNDEANIFPGAPEVCNYEDDDCDGAIDEEDTIDPFDWYLDVDIDGYGGGAAVVSCASPGADYVNEPGDCDDGDPEVNPGVEEICNTGIDDNCNGLADGCRPEGEIVADGVLLGGGGVPTTAVGDLNGDGADEFIVLQAGVDGSPVAEIHSSPVVGQVSPVALAPLIVSSPTDGLYVGEWLLVLGDTDRDEEAEWVIGGDISGSPNSPGAAYMFTSRYDNISMDLSVSAEIHGTEDEAQLGYSYEAPGDIGGDVGADLLLGQPFSNSRASYSGVVRGFYEPSGTYEDVDADLSLWGTSELLAFGTAICAGDFDADGLTDVAIGAIGDVGGYVDNGAIFVFEGPITENDSDYAFATLLGETDSRLGYRIEAPGDVDADGREDLWLSAPESSESHLEAGEWFLVTDLTRSRDVRDASIATIQGEDVGDNLGYFASVTTDFDADGNSDIFLHAWSDAGGDSAGKIHLFYGPFSGIIDAGDANASYTGSSRGANAGAAMSVPGDIDGDGNLDLMWFEGSTATSAVDQISFFYGWSW